jgi:hypothetical protein
MPLPRPSRPLSAPLRARVGSLAVAGAVLAVAGCASVAPIGPDSAPASFAPSRQLGSALVLQVMRSQQPTPAGRCPVSSVSLFGLALVPRAVTSHHRAGPPQLVHTHHAGAGSRPTPTSTPTAATAPATPNPAGVACFQPAGSPVTITSAAVSSVASFRYQAGPVTYGFLVAIPADFVQSVTAVIKHAYDSRDAVGISVAGKLWQAPHVVKPFVGQQIQIVLLSKSQAVQLHHLLVSGRS